jgi:hypothetical protein
MQCTAERGRCSYDRHGAARRDAGESGKAGAGSSVGIEGVSEWECLGWVWWRCWSLP